MKTAISIPDDVFEEAEQMAQREKCSRSELYSRAIADYLRRHAPDRVTDEMNRTLRELEGETDDFAPAAARRILGRSEW